MKAWDDDSCKGGELRSKDGCFGCLGSSHLLRVMVDFGWFERGIRLFFSLTCSLDLLGAGRLGSR